MPFCELFSYLCDIFFSLDEIVSILVESLPLVTGLLAGDLFHRIQLLVVITTLGRFDLVLCGSASFKLKVKSVGLVVEFTDFLISGYYIF